MVLPVKADIMQLFQGVITSLVPIAKAHRVALSYQTHLRSLDALYQPELIIVDFAKLLCRIISFTRQGFTVVVEVGLCSKNPSCIQITISSHGADLTMLSTIRSDLRHQVTSECLQDRTTSRFTMSIPLDPEAPRARLRAVKPKTILPWYNEIRKRLTAHFQNVENLEQAAREKGINQGLFMKKVNALISDNLDNERFNATELGTALAMSRTQLFRKLKALVQMSPSRYIRFFRLLRAKEMLEREDLNISEVAFRVGFVSASHFTRVFYHQFGFNPSSLKNRQTEELGNKGNI